MSYTAQQASSSKASLVAAGALLQQKEGFSPEEWREKADIAAKWVVDICNLRDKLSPATTGTARAKRAKTLKKANDWLARKNQVIPLQEVKDYAAHVKSLHQVFKKSEVDVLAQIGDPDIYFYSAPALTSELMNFRIELLIDFVISDEARKYLGLAMSSINRIADYDEMPAEDKRKLTVDELKPLYLALRQHANDVEALRAPGGKEKHADQYQKNRDAGTIRWAIKKQIWTADTVPDTESTAFRHVQLQESKEQRNAWKAKNPEAYAAAKQRQKDKKKLKQDTDEVFAESTLLADKARTAKSAAAKRA